MSKPFLHRIASALLCLALLVCCALPAALADANAQDIRFDQAGFSFKRPDMASELNGVLAMSRGALSGDDSIYEVALCYFGMDAERVTAISNNPNASEEERAELMNSFAIICTVDTVNGGRDYTAAAAAHNRADDDAGEVELLAQVGEYSFYYYASPDNSTVGDFAQSAAEPYASEFAALRSALHAALVDGEFFEPVLAKQSGRKVSFTTTDLSGAAVNSAELFAQHRYTIVNVWATWCPPCKAELPELEKLNARIAEYDCAVVGLLCETGDSALADARALVEQNGLTYTMLAQPDNIGEFFRSSAIPYTFFVDSEGNVVGEAVTGAHIASYEAVLNGLLAQPEG